MWHTFLFALAWLSSVAALSEEAADLSAARAPVVAFYLELTDTMKNAESLGLEGRRKKLAPAIEQAYDIPLMAAKVLGRHWRDLSDEDKGRWVETFRQITVSTYAERFDGWSGEELLVIDATVGARDTRIVHTKIGQPNADAVDIHYRMKERQGRWRIIDVYLNGTISELALRRSEYGSVIKADGLAVLIERLESKIEAGVASTEIASELP